MHAGFSLDRLDMEGFVPPPHMGGTSAGGQSVMGGTPEGGHKPYEGEPNLDRLYHKLKVLLLLLLLLLLLCCCCH